jgi:hypothetical protein
MTQSSLNVNLEAASSAILDENRGDQVIYSASISAPLNPAPAPQGPSGETFHNFPRGSYTCDINDIASQRRKFSFLKDFSDNFIRNTPLEILLKTETTSLKLKEFERNKAASIRLSNNRDELASVFSEIKEGQDNRWDQIHEARFLPGACCPTTKLWLRAREVLGDSTHVPVSCYDMNSIGLGGFVSKKGWIELHNIGSDSLSLKLFNINSCGNKVNTSNKSDTSDEFRDIVDLGEFKLALRVAREAMSLVHPWNKSISALEGFFNLSDYCRQDLTGVEKPGAALAQFVDYIFGENSDRWRGQLPFLTTGELKASWDAFWGARPESKVKSKNTASNPPSSNNSGSSSGSGTGNGYRQYSRQQLYDRNYFDDVCRMYNFGKCVKPAGTCTTKGGIPLRHVCNFRINQANPRDICGKNHPAIFNH